jgi:hypothetical protein
VERSTDGNYWESVAFLQGAGNSNEVSTYSWVDSYDGKGSTLYYRLTQYDYNGDYEILGVQSIVCTNLPEDSWITINTDIFNNIIINFLATQGEKYEIKLYDLHGKLIFYQTGTTNNTYEHLVISTYGIPSSIYLVDVHTTIHNKTQKVYLKELDF